MKIQIDVPKELNKKLKIYKVREELNDLKEAIIKILNKFFGVKEK